MVRTEKRGVKIKPLGEPLGIQEDVTIISTSKDMVNTARELLKNLEAAEKKETNFSCITESPEALAEWILKISGNCAWCRDGGNPKFCPCNGESCLFEDDGCVKWLKQESEAWNTK